MKDVCLCIYFSVGDICAVSSAGVGDKSKDCSHIQETLNDHQPQMVCSAQGPVGEEYDSDFDDTSHEDDEPLTHEDAVNEDEEEQHSQFIVRYCFKIKTYYLFLYF